MANDILKNKCDVLLKEIFESNFYFVHGTSVWKAEQILKSGKIKISTKVKNKDRYFTFQYDPTKETEKEMTIVVIQL